MIAYLKGKLISVDFEKAIIDVNGVGYGVNLSVRSAAKLVAGDEVEVFISEVVREQVFDLYGFLDIEEQKLFETLTKASGVGPKLGLAMLGLGTPGEIASAVASEDDRYFSRAPGVGKKLAERLIIELRDKVSYLESSPHSHGDDPGQSIDAEAALRSLGFKSDDINQMMNDVDKSLTVEEQIKQALTRK